MKIPDESYRYILCCTAGTESRDTSGHPALPLSFWLPPHDEQRRPEQVSITFRICLY